jgi:hypothetical protein
MFAFPEPYEPVLFDRDNNVVLAGFGHASYHPPRGQFLQGNIAVSLALCLYRFPGVPF